MNPTTTTSIIPVHILDAGLIIKRNSHSPGPQRRRKSLHGTRRSTSRRNSLSSSHVSDTQKTDNPMTDPPRYSETSTTQPTIDTSSSVYAHDLKQRIVPVSTLFSSIPIKKSSSLPHRKRKGGTMAKVKDALKKASNIVVKKSESVMASFSSTSTVEHVPDTTLRYDHSGNINEFMDSVNNRLLQEQSVSNTGPVARSSISKGTQRRPSLPLYSRRVVAAGITGPARSQPPSVSQSSSRRGTLDSGLSKTQYTTAEAADAAFFSRRIRLIDILRSLSHESRFSSYSTSTNASSTATSFDNSNSLYNGIPHVLSRSSVFTSSLATLPPYTLHSSFSRPSLSHTLSRPSISISPTGSLPSLPPPVYSSTLMLFRLSTTGTPCTNHSDPGPSVTQSEPNLVPVTTTVPSSEHSTSATPTVEDEKRSRGVDMDALLRRIVGDDGVKRQLLVGGYLSARQVHPHLFGDSDNSLERLLERIAKEGEEDKKRDVVAVGGEAGEASLEPSEKERGRGLWKKQGGYSGSRYVSEDEESVDSFCSFQQRKRRSSKSKKDGKHNPVVQETRSKKPPLTITSTAQEKPSTFGSFFMTDFMRRTRMPTPIQGDWPIVDWEEDEDPTEEYDKRNHHQAHGTLVVLDPLPEDATEQANEPSPKPHPITSTQTHLRSISSSRQRHNKHHSQSYSRSHSRCASHDSTASSTHPPLRLSLHKPCDLYEFELLLEKRKYGDWEDRKRVQSLSAAMNSELKFPGRIVPPPQQQQQQQRQVPGSQKGKGVSRSREGSVTSFISKNVFQRVASLSSLSRSRNPSCTKSIRSMTKPRDKKSRQTKWTRSRQASQGTQASFSGGDKNRILYDMDDAFSVYDLDEDNDSGSFFGPGTGSGVEDQPPTEVLFDVQEEIENSILD